MRIIDMRLSCPNCSTEYEVPDAELAGRSRKLRCERCETQWQYVVPAAPAGQEDRPEPVAPQTPEDEPPAEERKDWPSLPVEEDLNMFPPAEPRRFGQPVDAAAQAEIIQAAIQEQKGPPTDAGTPAPAETDAQEDLPRFLTEAPPSDMTPDAANRFAELVHAAQNKSAEYEPDPGAGLSPARIGRSPLFVPLLLLFIIACVALEHRNIIHYMPASARFFTAFGLK